MSKALKVPRKGWRSARPSLSVALAERALYRAPPALYVTWTERLRGSREARSMADKIVKSESQLRAQLTPD